jgi:hypothetical protein
MKEKTLSAVLWLVVLLSVFSLAFSFMPAPAAQVPAPTPLDIILKIAMGFGALAGVSALVSMLVQIFKLAGLIKDGNTGKWTAAFNLAAFVVLVYFGVFQPSVALEVLDGYAAYLAQIALFVLGFVVQMTTAKPVYAAFKNARVPLFGFSYSAKLIPK